MLVGRSGKPTTNRAIQNATPSSTGPATSRTSPGKVSPLLRRYAPSPTATAAITMARGQYHFPSFKFSSSSTYHESAR